MLSEGADVSASFPGRSASSLCPVSVSSGSGVGVSGSFPGVPAEGSSGLPGVSVPSSSPGFPGSVPSSVPSSGVVSGSFSGTATGTAANEPSRRTWPVSNMPSGSPEMWSL